MTTRQASTNRCRKRLVPGCPAILGTLLLVLAWCVPALGEPGWVATTADFRLMPVSLVKIDAGGVVVVPVGASTPKTIAYDEFLQVERASLVATASQPYALVLLSGDSFQGEPAGYKDERIIWKNPTLGELSIPLKLCRGILRTGKTPDAIATPRNDDLIAMINGDSAKGFIADIAAQGMKIDVGGSVVNIPLVSVSYVQFGQTARPRPLTGRAFRVRMRDGSVFTSAQVSASDDGLDCTPAGDGKPRHVPLDAVVQVEQLNGPVSWLSSRVPEKIVQIPYFSKVPKPTRMDAALGERPWSDGPKPITFGTQAYSRGIGVASYSRIDYALDGSYKAFRTQYAIAAGRTQYADVTVRIKLDGKTVHEREHFQAGELSPVVVVDIPATAKLLTLEVDYGANEDAQDRFNWIEPALLRDKPAPPTTSPATGP